MEFIYTLFIRILYGRVEIHLSNKIKMKRDFPVELGIITLTAGVSQVTGLPNADFQSLALTRNRHK